MSTKDTRNHPLDSLDEDIRLHIEIETQDNIAKRMPPKEAHYAAVHKFGNVSIGIYGVISYVVSERTREIGIRIALGAQRSTVLRLMRGEGMKMAMIGVVVGIVAAAGLTRLMSQLIYGVSAADPVTFAGLIVVVTAVAFAACYLPARRAMRVDPMVAVRYE